MVRFIYILQLCHEDTDIHDPACKCLSLLVQLFGGEHKEALNPENMVKFVTGLPRSGKNIWKMKFFPGQGKVREFC